MPTVCSRVTTVVVCVRTGSTPVAMSATTAIAATAIPETNIRAWDRSRVMAGLPHLVTEPFPWLVLGLAVRKLCRRLDRSETGATRGWFAARRQRCIRMPQ